MTETPAKPTSITANDELNTTVAGDGTTSEPVNGHRATLVQAQSGEGLEDENGPKPEQIDVDEGMFPILY